MLLGVLLAAFFDMRVVSVNVVGGVLWALATTCVIASSNYVLNEILDGPSDRHHPLKRHRPVPSGDVRVPLAYAEWLTLAAIGLMMASAVNRPFFFSALALLVMGMIYNVPPVRSKALPYVDVLSESINNPIRLLLGWFAVTQLHVPPLSLLLAYWTIGAYFMTAKRLAEYRYLGAAAAGAYRQSFKYYNEQRLLVAIIFYITCFSLFLGVFIVRWHLELILSFPVIAGFISYYTSVTLKHDSAAQSPERLYRDKGTVAFLGTCLLVFLILMFVEIPQLLDLLDVPPSQVPPLWKF
jgi:4-hydroxybenzoate polyprenyltransferase